MTREVIGATQKMPMSLVGAMSLELAKSELSGEEKRRIRRVAAAGENFPVRFVFTNNGQEIPTALVNYHYRGACLQVRAEHQALLKKNWESWRVDFYLGKKSLVRGIAFRRVWDSFGSEGQVGVEFQKDLKPFIPRPERFRVHEQYPPILTVSDPLDPNRRVFCRVINFSETGMLLSSSLSNRHLFPGMTLTAAQLTFPGQGATKVNLQIENTRCAEGDGLFHLGVSVQEGETEYREHIRKYATALTPDTSPGSSNNEEESRIELLSRHHMLSRKFKEDLSFRAIQTEADYEKVLRLRFSGYGAHGKIKKGSTWKDQGEGLREEGFLLGAFLGGELVASVELRFGDRQPLRIFKSLTQKDLPHLNPVECVEINRLVTHPKAQGSDVVVGMFQKIHAVVLNHGQFHGLVVATEKLTPLYERLGFRAVGRSFPHPYVSTLSLRPMLLPRETYLEGREINPFRWYVIYFETQRYLSQYGLAPTPRLNPLKQIWLKVSEQIYRFQQKTQLGKAPKTATGTLDVDPRWTEQHIHTSVLKPYLLEGDAMVGADRVNHILSTLKMPRRYLDGQTNWVSIRFLDAFLEEFSKVGAVAELSSRAGLRSMAKDVLGLKYYFIKHFATPEKAFRALEKILPVFNKTRTYRVVRSTERGGIVSLGLVSRHLLPKHREGCINFESSFLAGIRLMTGRKERVEKLTCLYDGADSCTYQLHWVPTHGTLFPYLCGTTITLGIVQLLRGIALPPVFTTPVISLLAVAVVALGWLGIELYGRSKDKDELGQQFDDFERETQARYVELQDAKSNLDQRFNELTLIEETAKAIQGSLALKDILTESLSAVCDRFGFSRAFVMLKSDGKDQLETSAVHMSGPGVQDLWEFKVSIAQQKENPLLLSSVYHSGQPVIINNVADHRFQLNEHSQKLIDRLGSKAFLMVAIPSQDRNWGVVIADRAQDAQTLTKYDVRLLQRIAQHMGIALDKQAKLDQEKNLRMQFQKYVPGEVVNTLAESGGALLGGETREITCLFLDIQDYTKMTERMAPSVVLGLLNGFYEMVHEIVSKHHGWIDKFLGDGVFATWGAVGKHQTHAESSVKAALEILERLDHLNREWARKGWPMLQVRMGIHKGPAVVGNIGTDKRMEFGVLGTTVNTASRLEGIAKVFQSSLVLSEAVLRDVEKEVALFDIKEGVQVRGLTELVTVGVLRKNSVNEVGVA